ncbi:MAG: phosphotransferase family protein [Bryobacteraceae bacterium]
MAPAHDPTAPPRPGEELDAGPLADWLRPRVAGAVGELTVEQFPSGHSNLTYLIRMGNEEWVLRRPPFGSQVKSAHDMGREYQILSRLCRVYAPAPEPVLFCDDASVLGAPFYLMRRLHGVLIRKTLPPSIPPLPDLLGRIAAAFIGNLATLHAVDLRAAGLDTFGKPAGYSARQIEGWTRRWDAAATEPVADMQSLAGWLAAHLPQQPTAAPAVIHNDYKFDNVLLDASEPTRIAGVFDWEMATVGDPWMDLGTALSYWIDPTDPPEFQALTFSPTNLPGFPTRAGILALYEEASGRKVPNPVFYYAYGLFKLAVILQQIYYRYAQGLTDDPRFAEFPPVVRGLARQGWAAAESGSLQPGGGG